VELDSDCSKMPFLGILDDHKLPHVPGTVILEEQAAQSTGVTGALKHGTGRNANIILIPQPSDDPNDPLNWPQWKKLTTLCVTLSGSVLYAAVCSAMLNPAFFAISVELNTTVGALVLATGYQTLVIGVTGPIFSALGRKYGKRPIFLWASIVCLVGNIVGSTQSSYTGILVSRIMQGFAIAPYESLIFALISDLFFVHERGVYTALINFVLAGISNLTGVVSGPIATNLGWQWIYHLCVILGAIQTIAQFFFAPETSYVRDARYEIDERIDDDLEGLAQLEHRHGPQSVEEKAVDVRTENVLTATTSAVPKKTYSQELAIFNGTFSKENLFQLFIAPFAVVTNLAILWVVLVSSVFVTLYVVIAFVMAQEFAPPPYLLSPTDIGLLSLGPFVGGLIGALALGAGLDPLIRWCARKNNGVYEPEYRLLPAFLGLVSGAGMFAWGTMVNNGVSPVACAVVHGIILFGTIGICIATNAYIIDAYRAMTAEVFIASMAAKNLLIYGFSYFVNNWTATAGIKHTFYVWGGLGIALTATAPLLYFFGKKYRSFWVRHDLMKKFGVITHEE
jgi:MFS family permease